MLSRIVSILTEVEKRMDYYKRHDNPPEVDLKKILVDKLWEYDGYEFWSVDGEYVRDNIDIDFVEGGNPGRYGYVPEKHRWIEEVIDKGDIVPTAVHEHIESILMEDYGFSYDDAHEIASDYEVEIRKNVYERNFFDNFKKIVDAIDFKEIV